MNNKNIIVACAITAVVAGGIGFWGNNIFQQNQRNNRFGQMGNRTRFPNSSIQPNQGMKGGILVGEVIAKDDKSITIKLQDGSSKIILLSSTTNYRISSESKLESVEVGKTISIMGPTNSDGSTTANNIELNPSVRPQGLGQKQ